jgi:hypothetical protein
MTFCRKKPFYTSKTKNGLKDLHQYSNGAKTPSTPASQINALESSQRKKTLPPISFQEAVTQPINYLEGVD